MESLTIECLRCGRIRTTGGGPLQRLDSGECPRCGYVGWVATEEVDEPLRRALRERPVERRRLRVV